VSIVNVGLAISKRIRGISSENAWERRSPCLNSVRTHMNGVPIGTRYSLKVTIDAVRSQRNCLPKSNSHSLQYAQCRPNECKAESIDISLL